MPPTTPLTVINNDIESIDQLLQIYYMMMMMMMMMMITWSLEYTE